MKNLKQIYLGTLAVVLLIGGSIAFTGCNKENDTRGRNGSNVTGASTVSTDFKAALLSSNVPFLDEANDIEGYAWEWEIQRNAGKTALSHFNFINGILCADDEEAGSLKDHIVGAYYSQDGSTWNYVAVSWGIDGSTKGICYDDEVFKINYGGDNILIRLIMDSEYEVGVQYALFKRGKGDKKNAELFPECGIIQFAAPGCPVDDDDDPCWKGQTAWGGLTKGSGSSWWYVFDTHGSAEQAIYAGQKPVTGAYVTYSGGNIVITLGNNMELKDVNESVKVQGYNVDNLPSKRPAAGLFTLYKGTSLTITGNSSRYYAIHLDVLVKQEKCAEEE
jgi:hypothetical protein